jgi:Coenzyme PQQ synthesis protein D (PqqD)
MPPRFRQLAAMPDVLMQTVVGESVLLDLRSQKYFGLNQVGTRVWQLLQETGDVGDIRARLLAEYDVQPDQLERDLDDLLERLLRAGLVEQRRETA